MAALRVQSLVAVDSSSQGPSVVSNKGSGVKSVRSGSTSTLSLVFKKNRLSVGQNHASLRSNRVRLNCRGSNSPVETNESFENIDIADIVLNPSDMDLLAMSKAVKKSANEPAARPPKFTTLRPFGEGGAGVMSGLEGSMFELLAANIQATADLKR